MVENANNEISVRVLFLARRAMRWEQAEVDFVLHGTPTAESAFAAVMKNFPTWHGSDARSYFAVNQEYARADREVHDGDELALFPPVSGGSSKSCRLRNPQMPTFLRIDHEPDRCWLGCP